jgi:hypothetical protein
MKKYILYLAIIFISNNSFSQTNFTFLCDTDYFELNGNLLNLRKNKSSYNSEFELRIWFSNGAVIPHKDYLINLIYNDNKWEGLSYTFLHKNKIKIRCFKIQNVNFDSLFTILINNDLLNLPRQGVLKYRAFEEKESDLIIMDGTTYRFELITPYCRRRYEYYCPQEYAKHYNYNEYKNVVNILKKLFLIINDDFVVH